MIWENYYTQHRLRVNKPEHRVQIFLRGTGKIGKIELDTTSGKVTFYLEDLPQDDDRARKAVDLFGQFVAWADDAMPQVAGL